MTNQTITFTVTINVDTNQDPETVARALHDELENVISDWNDNWSEISRFSVDRALTEQDLAQQRLERRQAFRAARRNRQN